jgi:hypothetical protein
VRADVEAAGKDIQASLEAKPELMTSAEQDVVAAATPRPVAPEAAERPSRNRPLLRQAPSPAKTTSSPWPLPGRAASAAKTPPSRKRRGAADEPATTEEKRIEATKAPLMDHLIELRGRLIKALAAFALAAVVCFFFARNIYNVLTWPYVWVAGPENSKFIYTGLLEYFIVQLKLAMFGGPSLRFR